MIPSLPTENDFLELIKSYSIKENEGIIIADGSGSNKDAPCGYHAFTFLHNKIDSYCGFLNYGTVNLAELLPFVHVLWKLWYIECPIRTYYCFSDSLVTVKCGNKLYDRSSNFFWKPVELLEETGFKLNWNWLPRNSNNILKYLDYSSKQMRMLI